MRIIKISFFELARPEISELINVIVEYTQFVTTMNKFYVFWLILDITASITINNSYQNCMITLRNVLFFIESFDLLTRIYTCFINELQNVFHQFTIQFFYYSKKNSIEILKNIKHSQRWTYLECLNSWYVPFGDF